MTNFAYTRGRSFEYERVHFHRANGALVAVRTAGSRSPWDLLALYPNRLVLEQCKRVSELTQDMSFEKDRQFLSAFPTPAGVETFLVVRGAGGLTKVFPLSSKAPNAHQTLVIAAPVNPVPGDTS